MDTGLHFLSSCLWMFSEHVVGLSLQYNSCGYIIIKVVCCIIVKGWHVVSSVSFSFRKIKMHSGVHVRTVCNEELVVGPIQKDKYKVCNKIGSLFFTDYQMHQIN